MCVIKEYNCKIVAQGKSHVGSCTAITNPKLQHLRETTSTSLNLLFLGRNKTHESQTLNLYELLGMKHRYNINIYAKLITRGG